MDIIKKELCDFIAENILAGEVIVLPDTVLSDIGVDSFSIIEIILFIDELHLLVGAGKTDGAMDA